MFVQKQKSFFLSYSIRGKLYGEKYYSTYCLLDTLSYGNHSRLFEHIVFVESQNTMRYVKHCSVNIMQIRFPGVRLM